MNGFPNTKNLPMITGIKWTKHTARWGALALGLLLALGPVSQARVVSENGNPDLATANRSVVLFGMVPLDPAGMLPAPLAQVPAPAILPEPDAATKARIVEVYGKLPLSFEANHGQTDGLVKYVARGRGYTLFLTPTEAVLVLKNQPLAVSDQQSARTDQTKNPSQTALRMQLVGANPHPKIAGLDKLPGKSNYFIGNDPKKWRTNVPNYARVRYQNVFPGVDLVYYGKQRQLEYDFVIAPGADPTAITLAFEGADKLEIDDRGNLVLQIPHGQVIQHAPVIYQEMDGDRQPINGHYVLKGNHHVAFQIGAYDVRRPLIIDPVVLTYSSYLGGTNADIGNDIAVDAAGNAYVTGSTVSEAPTPFPTTAGAFQTALASSGFTDAFVTKLNPAGTALVYSTYLGGGNSDFGQGIAVDVANNAYVTGSTASAAPTAFPTTPGAFQTALANAAAVTDAFITKLNPTGGGAADLVYSTYLGGGAGDVGNDIAIDGVGNVYVTGSTASSALIPPPFPTADSPFQPTLGGDTDAFVSKLNPAGGGAADLVYSTYLGGLNSEIGRGIALDPMDNAYVTGETDTSETDVPPFPIASFQDNFGGVTDAFISKIEETAVPPPPPPGPGGGGGGGCFIATAAFGSDLAPQVELLRKFRDRYLLSHAAGRVFVKLYYTISPPLAEQIAESEILRAIARVGLVPIIGWVTLFLWSPTLGLGISLAAVGFGGWLPLRAARRRQHTRANHSVPQAEDEARSRRAARWVRLTIWGCFLFILSTPAPLTAGQGERSQAGSRVELVGNVRLPKAIRFALIRDPELAHLGLYKDGEPIFQGQSPLPLGKITTVYDHALIITLPSGQVIEIPEGARLPGPHGLIFVRSALIDTLRFQIRVGGADRTEEDYSVVDILGRRAILQRDVIADESRRATLAEMVNRIPFVEVAADTWEIPGQSLQEIGNHVGPLLTETLRSASPIVTMNDGVGLKLHNALGSGTLDRRGFKIGYAKLARRTGLKVGDVILSVNGQPVNSAGGLVRIYRQLKSDSSVSDVKVLIERNNKLRTLTYHIR